MQPARHLGILILLLALPVRTAAEAPRSQARIIVPECLVRSGPSLKYYPTNKLRLGQEVEVVQERSDGWLAIAPPLGSFSWLEAKYLERGVQSLIVVKDPVHALVGSELADDKPNVKGPELQRGTILQAINQPVNKQGGLWQAVVAPWSETRYIQAKEVEISGTTSERSGMYSLAQAPRSPGTTTFQPVSRSEPARPSWQPASNGVLTSTTSPTRSPSAAEANLPRLGPPSSAVPEQPRCASAWTYNAQGWWSAVGRLRATGHGYPSWPQFALEGVRGEVLLYLTPQTGLDLRPFLGQLVQVHGVRSPRRDVRLDHWDVDYIQIVRVP